MLYFRHMNKEIIREQWCKPLLHHINAVLGYKLIYLGLPGVEALDILSWIKYLEKIIAFQCRKYGKPSKPGQPKGEIEKLDKILSDLEKKHIIRTYSLFDGYIEEVVLSGTDNSGNDFSQKDVVTVYNLDFCNPLTVPLIIVDMKGNISKRYKLEAIRKLLEFQRNILSKERQNKFIMFLTVHSRFWESEAKKLIGIVGSDFRPYMEAVSRLNGQEKNIRLLRLYVFYVLKNHFLECKFIPEFLPSIYYRGFGGSWLMNFTIIGTYHKNASAYAPSQQDTKSFLENKFLSVNGKEITYLDSKNIKEKATKKDSVKLFCDTTSYKEFWKQKDKSIK